MGEWVLTDLGYRYAIRKNNCVSYFLHEPQQTTEMQLPSEIIDIIIKSKLSEQSGEIFRKK